MILSGQEILARLGGDVKIDPFNALRPQPQQL